jgi:hypothetical protein
MSFNTIPVDLDKYKLRDLLERYHQKKLSPEDALELRPLIERIWQNALDVNDMKTASEMSTILIALNAYIHGRVSLYDPPKVNKVAIS